MAWTIKAGNGNGGQGTASLSIASNNQAAVSGWRFVSTPCHYPTPDPHLVPASSKQAWQDVLAQLTA
jgi:hypothetical protein